MASNNIELRIGSVFSAEGFKKLDGALKRSKESVSRSASAVGNLLSTFDKLGGSVGKVAKAGGQLMSGFLSLGLWGAVVAAIGAAVGKMMEWNKEIENGRLLAWNMRKEFMTPEFQKEAYNRRVEQYKKEAEDKIKREEDERKRSEEALKRRFQQEENMLELYNKTLDIKKKIITEDRKQAEIGKSGLDLLKIQGENAIAEARSVVGGKQGNLAAAITGGDKLVITMAEEDLALAEKQLETTIKTWRDKIKKEIESIQKKRREEEQKAIDEERKQYERERKAQEAAELKLKIAKREEENAKRIKDLDERIAKAKKRAAELEENAARARGGVTFARWTAGEQDIAREKRLKDERQARVIAQATRERDALEERLSKTGKKARSKVDLDKLARLNEFINNQDPENNPALREVKDLETEKAQAVKDLKILTEQIRDYLQDATTV